MCPWTPSAARRSPQAQQARRWSRGAEARTGESSAAPARAFATSCRAYPNFPLSASSSSRARSGSRPRNHRHLMTSCQAALAKLPRSASGAVHSCQHRGRYAACSQKGSRTCCRPQGLPCTHPSGTAGPGSHGQPDSLLPSPAVAASAAARAQEQHHRNRGCRGARARGPRRGPSPADPPRSRTQETNEHVPATMAPSAPAVPRHCYPAGIGATWVPQPRMRPVTVGSKPAAWSPSHRSMLHCAEMSGCPNLWTIRSPRHRTCSATSRVPRGCHCVLEECSSRSGARPA
mmetsp:Transcript_126356/g.404531  ORF Transcript_126356/g.404531 Transcript_126356/m.404531 type:complete len:289 (-) Transcript_126356:511-1377(-)